MAVVRAVHDVISSRGDSLLPEERQSERSLPRMAPVIRIVEPRYAGVDRRHPTGHGEVGMREVDAAGAFDGLWLGLSGGQSAVANAGSSHEHMLVGRMLN